MALKSLMPCRAGLSAVGFARLPRITCSGDDRCGITSSNTLRAWVRCARDPRSDQNRRSKRPRQGYAEHVFRHENVRLSGQSCSRESQRASTSGTWHGVVEHRQWRGAISTPPPARRQRSLRRRASASRCGADVEERRKNPRSHVTAKSPDDTGAESARRQFASLAGLADHGRPLGKRNPRPVGSDPRYSPALAHGGRSRVHRIQAGCRTPRGMDGPRASGWRGSSRRRTVSNGSEPAAIDNEFGPVG